MREADHTHAELTALLCYDASTGKFYWLERSRARFRCDRSWMIWNTRYANEEAFTTVSHGYRKTIIAGRGYQAHRVAWLLFHGVWPSGQIDHINGDPSDNRIENLRDVSSVENMRNQTMNSRNTSGFNGVCWSSANKRWHARVKIGGRNKHLGYFSDKESAILARRAANDQYGFTERHGLSRGNRNQGGSVSRNNHNRPA